MEEEPEGLHVERCIFENNGTAIEQTEDTKVTNSIFRNNQLGIRSGVRAYSSTFISNHTAIEWGKEIVASLIISNNTGISSATGQIHHNTIAYNRTGVILGHSPSFEGNNIFKNTEYNLRTVGSNNKDAPNNWWGTTDTDTIEEGIYDGRDDPLLGLVNYEPFLLVPLDIGLSERQFLPLLLN